MKDGEFLESLVESFCRDQFRAYSEVGKSSWELFVQLKLLFFSIFEVRSLLLMSRFHEIPSRLPVDS